MPREGPVYGACFAVCAPAGMPPDVIADRRFSCLAEEEKDKT
jgi:hypothetical protein